MKLPLILFGRHLDLGAAGGHSFARTRRRRSNDEKRGLTPLCVQIFDHLRSKGEPRTAPGANQAFTLILANVCLS